jgi:cytochrome b pre-mRNA-processing protein 3
MGTRQAIASPGACLNMRPTLCGQARVVAKAFGERGGRLIGRILGRLLGRDAARDALVPLYRSIVAAARRPVWYRAGGVPDTIDGRFDMIAAILSLVLLRLEGEGDGGRTPSARLTELFITDMDGQLRQQGIGDIVVGKHMGKLMGALGGRLGAFRDGLAAGGDLDGAIRRNLLRGKSPQPGEVEVLRDGLVALKTALDATPAHELLHGDWQE